MKHVERCSILKGRVAAQVSTPYGPVQGFTDGISALFLGIPYAEPPTGGLRFAPPVPPKPWHEYVSIAAAACGSWSACVTRCGSGMVYGMYPGPACPQGAAWGYNITMWEEDCLFISIYSPPSARLNLYHNVTPDAGTLRPVAVFLHGGGFIAGSGHQTMCVQLQPRRLPAEVWCSHAPWNWPATTPPNLRVRRTQWW